MFENLEEQIKTTEGREQPTAVNKAVRFAGIIVLATVVFGGLCAIILALE